MIHDSRSLGSRRSAFTLAEILVVIAIIAVLASLASWGVIAMVGRQTARNTEATMRVVNKALQDHWRFVIDEAKKDTPSQAVVNLAKGPNPMVDLDPTGARARVIWIKCRLAEAFPQSYAEIIPNPPVYASGYIPTNQRRYNSDYVARLANLNVAATNPPTQSSACLLIALSVSRGGTSLNEDAIRHAIADTDGDGIKEIVDGWKTPLTFIRFAYGTNVQQVNPAAASPTARAFKFADPVDSDGMLVTPNWYASPNRATFDGRFHQISANAGTTANYVIPAIVSAGPDKNIALNTDASPIAPGGNDNIFNFNLRLD